MVRSNSTIKRYSLHRDSRIRKKEDFNALKKKALKLVARHWVLFYSKSDRVGSRLAMTVSSRYGSAVERNGFKRWLRESFRRELRVLSGFDFHFIAKQKPTNLEKKRYKTELDEDLRRLVQKLG